MTIALACDHAGYALKEEIKTHLLQEGYECKDFGTFSAEVKVYNGVNATVYVSVGEE